MSDLANYLESVLDHRKGDPLWGAAKIGPEYWADAPWRLDPNAEWLPLSFIARDAIGEVITDIFVYKGNGKKPIEKFPGPGEIQQLYWFYSPTPKIKRPKGYVPDKTWSMPGRKLKLRVEFVNNQQNPPVILYGQYLEIFIARDPLPFGNSSEWAYGDTHYHSMYTNDIKEFGNPISDTRHAAQGLGLDWLIITDHSVDLKDANPYWWNKTPHDRWKAVAKDVKDHSDATFCLIRGEEVSVKGAPGKGDDTLHLLVFGDKFDKMIPGSFLDSNLLSEVIYASQKLLASKIMISYLFGKIYPLTEVLTGCDSSGKNVPELENCSIENQGVLAFAAHPSSNAQGLFGTWEQSDLMQPIHGMEAWNTRIRKKSGNEKNPFGKWRHHHKQLAIKENAAIQHWDSILRTRLNLQDPRFVILGGSDAHGSFNYDVYWGIPVDPLLVVNDNCLGKVRTMIYLAGRDASPQKLAPSQSDVIEAIRHGSCVVTDGPVITFSVNFLGKTGKLGDVLDGLSGDGDVEVNVQCESTEEFGLVKQFVLYWYFQGMPDLGERVIPYPISKNNIFELNSSSGAGYIRIETITETEVEQFHCVTNPIWFRFKNDGKRHIHIVSTS